MYYLYIYVCIYADSCAHIYICHILWPYAIQMKHTENQQMRALPHRARLRQEEEDFYFYFIRICPFKNKYGSSFFCIVCQRQATLLIAEEFHILLFFSALSLETEWKKQHTHTPGLLVLISSVTASRIFRQVVIKQGRQLWIEVSN